MALKKEPKSQKQALGVSIYIVGKIASKNMEVGFQTSHADQHIYNIVTFWHLS